MRKNINIMPQPYMKTFALIFTLSLLQGCTIYARSTYVFENYEGIPAVLYDPEAEDIAEKTQHALAASIADIERQQYLAFKDLHVLKIFHFATKERYARFSNSSPKARGSATKNEIYISPILRERIETLGAILRHELSHVHIRQHIGTWRYWSEVPGWYLEGLAVEVSGGGGAENVSPEQAITAIKSGKHFIPREESGLLGHKYAHNYDLEPHMYYRQSSLFVRFLIKKNPEAFREVYLGLINGVSFKDAWVMKYGKPIPGLWQEFINQASTYQAGNGNYLENMRTDLAVNKPVTQ